MRRNTTTGFYLLLIFISTVLISGCVHNKALKSGQDHKETTVQERIINKKDGMQMCYIPASKYKMGSVEGHRDEKPQHEVCVEQFYIDEHEVNVRQYGAFMKETSHPAPMYWNPNIDLLDEPVVGVSWSDAKAYAAWAGKRLPTEAEWELVARGKDIEENVCDEGHANVNSFGLLPVKSLNPNAFGVYDMLGNVWEWCSDWYGNEYYALSPTENPAGPNRGVYKVLRGGAWYSDRSCRLITNRSDRSCQLMTNRFYASPDSKSFNSGFRCVVSEQVD